jgi:pilus assembly protein CpaB
MKRGSRVLLFLVLAIIILIAVFFLVYFQGFGGQFFGAASPQPTAVEVVPLVNIVVAKQPINRDDKITQDVIEIRQIPQNLLSANMLQNESDVVGKYAVNSMDQMAYFTAGLLAESPGMHQPGSEAAKVVSPGLVAISMPIDLLGSVAYAIRDGDRVNVIATTKFIDVDATFQSKLPNYTARVTGTGFVPDALPVLSALIESGGEGSKVGRAELDPTISQALYLVPSENQRPRLVSQMILQDIQVLHMGKFNIGGSQSAAQATPVPAVEGQPAPTPTPAPADPAVITLIVNPQDAVALTYLMNNGAMFTFVLRAPDDTSRVETEAATLQYLLSQYAIPVPAKLPYVMEAMPVSPTPTPAPAP